MRLAMADLAAVGEILKAQGIRGEVKVAPLTDDPGRFRMIQRVFFQNAAGWRELKIRSQRPFKEFILLGFEGVDDMTAAESLGRGLIYIPKDERPKLPPGRYYYDEIEGLRVVTTAGDALGTVTQIMTTGANDVYVVRGASGEILLPALQSVIRTIDLTGGTITVELPPGLVEE